MFVLQFVNWSQYLVRHPAFQWQLATGYLLAAIYWNILFTQWWNTLLLQQTSSSIFCSHFKFFCNVGHQEWWLAKIVQLCSAFVKSNQPLNLTFIIFFFTGQVHCLVSNMAKTTFIVILTSKKSSSNFQISILSQSIEYQR